MKLTEDDAGGVGPGVEDVDRAADEEGTGVEGYDEDVDGGE